MKVILLTDVKAVGKKDQVIEVNDGYANNFLLPRKLAVPFTKGSIDVLKRQKQNALDKAEAKKAEALAIQDKLKNVRLVFKVKTGKDGKMFGSITPKEIESELLNKYQITIDKRKFVNYEPINRVGENQIAIELDKNIIGKIIVQVEEQ